MGRYVLGTLLAVTTLSWSALIIEAFADTLSDKGFMVLRAVAIAVSIVAAIVYHTERTERVMRRHTACMEDALKDHAGILAEHQSIITKIKDTWNRATVHVDQQSKAYADCPTDTGPFPAFRNGSLS